jgi:hypothetical protein
MAPVADELKIFGIVRSVAFLRASCCTKIVARRTERFPSGEIRDLIAHSKMITIKLVLGYVGSNSAD